MKPAVVIIDIQEWFFRTSRRRKSLPRLIKATNELIEFFHKNNFPVIHVITSHKKDKSTWDLIMKKQNRAVLIEGTMSVQEFDEIKKSNNDKVIKKTRHSAFIRTKFENYLNKNKIDTLILAGVFIDGCIGLTAIDGYERDFNVILSKDTVLGDNKFNSKAILNLLKNEFAIKSLSNKEVKDFILSNGI